MEDNIATEVVKESTVIKAANLVKLIGKLTDPGYSGKFPFDWLSNCIETFYYLTLFPEEIAIDFLWLYKLHSNFFNVRL